MLLYAVQSLTKACKAAAKSTALYTLTAAAAGLGTGTCSGSPQLPRPPPSLPTHLHPSNTLHQATRGRGMPEYPSRPRLLHERGSRCCSNTAPGRDGGCDNSHCLHRTAPLPQLLRGLCQPAGACEGDLQQLPPHHRHLQQQQRRQQ